MRDEALPEHCPDTLITVVILIFLSIFRFFTPPHIMSTKSVEVYKSSSGILRLDIHKKKDLLAFTLADPLD